MTKPVALTNSTGVAADDTIGNVPAPAAAATVAAASGEATAAGLVSTQAALDAIVADLTTLFAGVEDSLADLAGKVNAVRTDYTVHAPVDLTANDPATARA